MCLRRVKVRRRSYWPDPKTGGRYHIICLCGVRSVSHDDGVVYDLEISKSFLIKGFHDLGHGACTQCTYPISFCRRRCRVLSREYETRRRKLFSKSQLYGVFYVDNPNSTIALEKHYFPERNRSFRSRRKFPMVLYNVNFAFSQHELADY